MHGIRSRRVIIPLVFLIMMLFGGLDGLRGVSIPAVRADLSVSYNVLGLTLFGSTLAFIAALYAAGAVARNRGLKTVLVLGLLLTAVSHTVAPFAVHIAVYAVMLTVLQFGGGWLEVGLNAVGAEVFTRRAAVGMSLLHLFFGLGSTVFSRLGGGLIESSTGWRGAYFGALVVTVPLLIWTLVSSFPKHGVDEDNVDEDSIDKDNANKGSADDDRIVKDSHGAVSEQPHILRELKDPFVRWIALLLGAVIMVEIGIGSWLANFLVTQAGFGEATAGTWLALFWALFTLGRLICPFFAEHFGYKRTVALFSIAIMAAFAAGITMPSIPVFLSLTGLFVSIMYPTVMAILMARYPGRAGRLMSPVLIVAVSLANLSNWVFAAMHDVLGEYWGFAAIGLTPLLILGALYAVAVSARTPAQSFSSSSRSDSSG